MALFKETEIIESQIEYLINDKNNIQIKLKDLDSLLINTNKLKYQNDQNIIRMIQDSTIPKELPTNSTTLFALLNYFQKKYVFKNFILNFQQTSLQKRIPFSEIKIVSKPNNFPHLIGVKGERNENGIIVSKSKPRKFLDGVLYQWLLIDKLDTFIVDFEKFEVFSWIWQTLVTPTYILPKKAIDRKNTRFNADIIFIKKIFHSEKYSFHIVGLKHENGNNFTFVSQFPITIERFQRVNLMFDLKKAYYNFYLSKKKAPISSGSARSTK